MEDKLKDMSRKELEIKYICALGNCKRLSNRLERAKQFEHNIKLHLNLMKSKIEYLMVHPFSSGKGFSTRKNKTKDESKQPF